MTLKLHLSCSTLSADFKAFNPEQQWQLIKYLGKGQQPRSRCFITLLPGRTLRDTHPTSDLDKSRAKKVEVWGRRTNQQALISWRGHRSSDISEQNRIISNPSFARRRRPTNGHFVKYFLQNDNWQGVFSSFWTWFSTWLGDKFIHSKHRKVE